MSNQQIRRVALDAQAAQHTFGQIRQWVQGMFSLDPLAHVWRAMHSSRAASGMAGTAWLGILGLTVTPEVALAMRLLPGQQGILVEQIEQCGPADRAHLQAGNQSIVIDGHLQLVGGDIIGGVGGRRVRWLKDMQTFLQQARPGQVVTLTLLRNKEWMQVMVVLGERPVSAPPAGTPGGTTA